MRPTSGGLVGGADDFDHCDHAPATYLTDFQIALADFLFILDLDSHVCFQSNGHNCCASLGFLDAPGARCPCPLPCNGHVWVVRARRRLKDDALLYQRVIAWW